MKIGITGHQRISDPSTWPWVRNAIVEQLENAESLTGISSLAIGADQLFAQCVLEASGTLIAIIPFPDYERTFKQSDEKQKYINLKNQAAKVQILPDISDDQQSYLDAGKLVIELCEVLLAVWDGKPAKGKGGTGDAVNFAISTGRLVVHINPDNCTIKELGRSGSKVLAGR